MTDFRFRIFPPFANYHRAKLERKVQEAMEHIESFKAYDGHGDRDIDRPSLRPREFELLVAAEYYLRNTKK